MFRKGRKNTSGTLHFVRRNDILLQRGMTLVVPPPSLGVSSLDLGRSDPFERPIFLASMVGRDDYSAAALGMARPETAPISACTMRSKSSLRPSKACVFSKLPSSM